MRKGWKRFLQVAVGVFLLGSASFSITTNKTYMKKYCATPPYIEVASRPNVILLMDYSGSMQLPAHFGCSWSYSSRTARCNSGSHIHRTYNKNIAYYGYFDSTKYYRYNSSQGYWEVNPTCNVSASQQGIGSGQNCVSGNLLNWISMSRYDVALKVLTGGKPRSCGSSNSDLCLIPKGAERRVYEDTLDCDFHLIPASYWSNTTQFNSPAYDLRLSVYNHGGTCPIGTFSNRWMRVKIDPSTKEGVLYRNKDAADYALVVFSRSGISAFNRQGEIRFGIHEYRNAPNTELAMSQLMERMETELPWGGTPTGRGLQEVMDYIQQKNNYSYESNSAYISKGTQVDPYWDKKQEKVVPCKQNVVILISDGEWNVSPDPDAVALSLHVNDQRSDLEGAQLLDIFTLFAFANSNAGRNSMMTVAAAGSFVDVDGNNRPFDINVNNDSRNINFPRPNCDPAGTPNQKCKEWDKDNNGIPDFYYEASSGQEFEKAMNEILSTIVKYSYSGGSIGVLADKTKNQGAVTTYNGTVIGQALFYTQRDGVDWVGKLFGYWYHVPTNTIREDSDGNLVLNKTQDKILEFGINPTTKSLEISVFNVDSSGNKAGLSGTYSDPDQVKNLFEAGKKLFATHPDVRNILYPDTNCDPLINPSCLKTFSPTNAFSELTDTSSGLKLPLLGVTESCLNICSRWAFATSSSTAMFNEFYNCLMVNDDYGAMVDYVRGVDRPGYRSRTTTIDINGTSITDTWKLGDVMYSTPVFVQYPSTSVIYVGANDGMLHAFEVGSLSVNGINTSGGDVVKLDVSATNIGREIWAFIPYNLVPYLRFMANTNYCHLYYTDLSPYVFSFGGNLFLVSGFRLGGATGSSNSGDVKPPFWSCPKLNGDELATLCKNSCNNLSAQDCNKLADLNNAKAPCYGLSGYFVLDITDYNKPVFLWEFTHPDLGFSYSGPAVVYKGTNAYIVFGSGPTTYKADSNQSLKFFVLDLFTGDLVRVIDTNIQNAFSGRLFTEGFDRDGDGNTDYLFVGYGRRDGSMSNWKGGLIMMDVRSSNPLTWTYSIYFQDAQSPILTRVESAQCFGNNYIYFGSGRWFYKLDNPLSGQRDRLYGINVQCNSSGNCTLNTNVANVTNSSSNVCTDAQNGIIRSWYIELDLGSGAYLKERDITDPAFGANIVVFTSTKPPNDVCKFGGLTRVWALNCATGGALGENCPAYPLGTVEGKILLPLSGGDIKAIDLSNFGTNRSTAPFEGTPAESAPPFIGSSGGSGSSGSGEIILWIEK